MREVREVALWRSSAGDSSRARGEEGRIVAAPLSSTSVWMVEVCEGGSGGWARAIEDRVEHAGELRERR